MRFEARWPVKDESLTMSELRAEALPDLHALARRKHTLVIPPVAWGVEETARGRLVLVASARAFLLDDIADAAHRRKGGAA